MHREMWALSFALSSGYRGLKVWTREEDTKVPGRCLICPGNTQGTGPNFLAKCERKRWKARRQERPPLWPLASCVSLVALSLRRPRSSPLVALRGLHAKGFVLGKDYERKHKQHRWQMWVAPACSATAHSREWTRFLLLCCSGAL